MIITRATEYSITAVLYLAGKHPSPVVSKREICDAENITPAFLTKILQPLIRSGLVRSKRGVAGGFSLARDPESITLWDVMQAVDEPLSLNVCLIGDDECENTRYCPVHDMWDEVREKMEEIFTRRSVADLAQERQQNAAQQSVVHYQPAVEYGYPYLGTPLYPGYRPPLRPKPPPPRPRPEPYPSLPFSPPGQNR